MYVDHGMLRLLASSVVETCISVQMRFIVAEKRNVGTLHRHRSAIPPNDNTRTKCMCIYADGKHVRTRIHHTLSVMVRLCATTPATRGTRYRFSSFFLGQVRSFTQVRRTIAERAEFASHSRPTQTY